MGILFFAVLFCCFFAVCGASLDFVYFRFALVVFGFRGSTFSVVAVEGEDVVVSPELLSHKILPCLHFTPHALHSVPGPWGPLRHMGVVFRPQYEHSLLMFVLSVLLGLGFLGEDVFDSVGDEISGLLESA